MENNINRDIYAPTGEYLSITTTADKRLRGGQRGRGSGSPSRGTAAFRLNRLDLRLSAIDRDELGDREALRFDPEGNEERERGREREINACRARKTLARFVLATLPPRLGDFRLGEKKW